ncbi:hypothetical protein ACIQLJ_08515 [Microbacterium sp. NPDC091313]
MTERSGYSKNPNWFQRDLAGELSAVERSVWFTISNHCAGTEGWRMSREGIARESGASLSSTRRAIEHLESLGLVRVQRTSGRGRWNTYTVPTEPPPQVLRLMKTARPGPIAAAKPAHPEPVQGAEKGSTRAGKGLTMSRTKQEDPKRGLPSGTDNSGARRDTAHGGVVTSRAWDALSDEQRVILTDLARLGQNTPSPDMFRVCDALDDWWVDVSLRDAYGEVHDGLRGSAFGFDKRPTPSTLDAIATTEIRQTVAMNDLVMPDAVAIRLASRMAVGVAEPWSIPTTVTHVESEPER